MAGLRRLPHRGAMDAGIDIGFGVFFLALIAIGIASVGFWIWSLIDCVRNDQLSDNNRLIGILLIVFLGLLGSVVYLFLPRDRAPAKWDRYR